MNIIDIREAQHFLNIINPDGSNLIFQTFDDSAKKDTALVTTRVGNLETYEHKLTEMNEKGAGVFVTINRSRTNRRIKSDMLSARAIWQEDDTGTDKIPELKPSLVIETSAGKFHRYWLIKDGTEDLKQWEKVQQKLVDDWDSDPKVKDTCRVMRVPGFYHNKKEPFKTHIISDIKAVTYYEWDELVEYFMPKGSDKNTGNSDDFHPDDAFNVNDAIRKVLSAENFHDSLVRLALHLVNTSQMPPEEMKLYLEFLVRKSSCTDNQRIESTVSDIGASVDSAFKKVAGENCDAEYELGDYEVDKSNNCLELAWPPGLMGETARNVMSFMRYPSKEIAIETALHCTNVFAASSYEFLSSPNHRKTILLAPQGRGKNVVYRYIQKLCGAMCKGNMFNPLYLEFLGNGDYTSPKQMHLELQEFGSRSMISSEAGHAQATKVGDRVGTKGYENQLLMSSPDEFITPARKQNGVKGEDKQMLLHTICCSIIHESVVGNYAKLFADKQVFSDGSITRCNFIFIGEDDDIDNINLTHGKAKVEEQVINGMKHLADVYLEKGDPIHKHVGQFEPKEVMAEQGIVEMLLDLEKLYKRKRKQSAGIVESSLYVRKHVQIMQTCRLLAVLESAGSPVVTKEMLDWAIIRSDKINANLLYHATSGGLSDALSQLVVETMSWCVDYLKGIKKIKPTKTEVREKVIIGRVFKRILMNSKMELIKSLKTDPAYAYKSPTQLYNALIEELESCSMIKVLGNKDVFKREYSTRLTPRDFKILGEQK